MEGGEDRSRVGNRSRNRSHLVERPAQRHAAETADATIGRTKADNSAGARRRYDRPAGFGPNCEADESGRRRGSRAGRRAARSAFGVPRVPGSVAEPQIADRQLAGRQLGDEHCAGVAHARHRCRIVGKHLIGIRLSAPRREHILHREEILDPVRNAVERAAITAGLDLVIGFGGLRDRQILGERHDAVEDRVVSLQPLQIHRRQFRRRHNAGSDEFAQRAHGFKGQVFDAARTRWTDCSARESRRASLLARRAMVPARSCRKREAKTECGLGLRWEGDLANRVVAVAMTRHERPGAVTLAGRQIDANQLLRDIERVGRDRIGSRRRLLTRASE